MKQIRRNVFETNSSSTHSIAIASKNEFEKWRDGELLYQERWSAPDRFLTMAEAVEEAKLSTYYDGEFNDISAMDDYEIYEVLREYEIYDYEHWTRDYESDVTHYTTPGGEEIVAVCYYGYC